MEEKYIDLHIDTVCTLDKFKEDENVTLLFLANFSNTKNDEGIVYAKGENIEMVKLLIEYFKSNIETRMTFYNTVLNFINLHGEQEEIELLIKEINQLKSNK